MGKGKSTKKGNQETEGELRHSQSDEEDVEVDIESGKDQVDRSSADGQKLESKERYWVFHLFLATGSVYMAMLFTDWGSTRTGTTDHKGPRIRKRRSVRA